MVRRTPLEAGAEDGFESQPGINAVWTHGLVKPGNPTARRPGAIHLQLLGPPAVPADTRRRSAVADPSRPPIVGVDSPRTRSVPAVSAGSCAHDIPPPASCRRRGHPHPHRLRLPETSCRTCRDTVGKSEPDPASSPHSVRRPRRRLARRQQHGAVRGARHRCSVSRTADRCAHQPCGHRHRHRRADLPGWTRLPAERRSPDSVSLGVLRQGQVGRVEERRTLPGVAVTARVSLARFLDEELPKRPSVDDNNSLTCDNGA